MSVSRRKVLLAGAALPASGLFLSALGGQPPGGQPVPGRPGQPVPPGGMPMGRDPLLAACLLLGGRRQIEVCEFAMKGLQNDECKAFAKAEIDEHQGMKAKLKGFGFEYPTVAGAGGPGGAPGGAPGGQPGGPPPGGQPVPSAMVMVGRVPLPPGAADLIQVDHEVVEQCIRNYQATMSKKEGIKFDKAFVGDQLHQHQGLLDKVQVFQRHASPAMRGPLAEAQKVIEAHIATCEQLMQKLDAMK